MPASLKMNNSILHVLQPVFIGLGATLIFDLWGLFLKYTFKITPSNMCLVGRWILYMPEGVFRHSNINLTPQKNAECIVGWMAHYTTGILFAVTFLAFTGREGWIQHPALIPAILFGAVTVLAPFFIMQPSFGFGAAASKTANPAQARLRSLMNHVVFGAGLYLFGLLVSRSLAYGF